MAGAGGGRGDPGYPLNSHTWVSGPSRPWGQGWPRSGLPIKVSKWICVNTSLQALLRRQTGGETARGPLRQNFRGLN